MAHTLLSDIFITCHYILKAWVSYKFHYFHMWQVKECLSKQLEKMAIKLRAYDTGSLYGNKPIFVQMNSLMLNFCWLPTDLQTALQKKIQKVLHEL